MTVLLLGWLALIGMGLLAYAIEGSLMAPSVILALVWSAAFVALCLASDFFFPVSLRTVEIYLAGAGCFVLTSLMGRAARSPMAPLPDRSLRFARRLVLVSTWLSWLLLPAFVVSLQGLAANARGENFWMRLRNASIALADTPGGGPFSLLANAPLLALGIAFVATRLQLRGGCSKRLFWSAFLVALVYQTLTGARSSVFVLLVCIVVLRLTAERARKFRAFQICVAIGALFAVVFVVNQITLNKGVDKRSNTLLVNLNLVGKEALVHAVGGLVGFDQIAANPAMIRPSQNIGLFFVHTLNKLGAHIDESSRHAENLEVAHGYYTNVFTIYFCYFPRYGALGVIVIMLCLGWFAKACYMSCRAGSDTGAVLYALTVHGILISTIADEFFLTLNTWLKCLFIVAVAFHWPFHRGAPRPGGEASAAPQFVAGDGRTS